MWSHFGDAECEIAGSYYHDAAEHVNHYVNIFDQVLLRPQLAARFEAGWLTIAGGPIGPFSLVQADGRPDRAPIVFGVEF